MGNLIHESRLMQSLIGPKSKRLWNSLLVGLPPWPEPANALWQLPDHIVELTRSDVIFQNPEHRARPPRSRLVHTRDARLSGRGSPPASGSSPAFLMVATPRSRCRGQALEAGRRGGPPHR